jgi:hypothetical protein
MTTTARMRALAVARDLIGFPRIRGQKQARLLCKSYCRRGQRSRAAGAPVPELSTEPAPGLGAQAVVASARFTPQARTPHSLRFQRDRSAPTAWRAARASTPQHPAARARARAMTMKRPCVKRRLFLVASQSRSLGASYLQSTIRAHWPRHGLPTADRGAVVGPNATLAEAQSFPRHAKGRGSIRVRTLGSWEEDYIGSRREGHLRCAAPRLSASDGALADCLALAPRSRTLLRRRRARDCKIGHRAEAFPCPVRIVDVGLSRWA